MIVSPHIYAGILLFKGIFMKKKIIVTIICIVIFITSVITSICLLMAHRRNYNIIRMENGLLSSILKTRSNFMFEKLFSFMLVSFDFLYSDLGLPVYDYESPSLFLKYILVETEDKSDKIGYIYLEAFFDYNGKRYVQSFDIRHNRISSYIDQAEVLNTSGIPQNFEGCTTTLHDFAVLVDQVDFRYFADMKPDADIYGFEYIGDTNVFHKNSGEVKRYLLKNNTIIDGDMDEDMMLDNSVPVIYFIGAIRNEPIIDGHYTYTDYSDTEGIGIYIGYK